MRSFSVILLCFLSFFVGCLFSASFMSIDSNVNKKLENSRSNKIMKVHTAVKNAVITMQNDLIIAVISAPSHYDRRQVIRDTWAKDARDHKYSYIFFIGTFGLKEELHNALRNEQLANNDLVLLPHVQEQYNLLTKKVLQIFVWLSKNGEHRFVLKCDDDSFINMRELIKAPMLKSTDSLLYWGYFTGRAPVHHRGKWKESGWNICDQYVPYARGGGYILSRGVIKYLADNAHVFSAFQNEDVSVGLWLAPINLTRHHDINFDTEYRSRGCKNSYIITHPRSVASMKNLHKSLQDTGKLCVKEESLRQAYSYDWNVPPIQCCQNIVKT